MSREIPQNTVRTSTYPVSKDRLTELLDELGDNSNVVKYEVEPAGSNMVVTIHFAVMDLALQLQALSTKFETMVDEINTPTFGSV